MRREFAAVCCAVLLLFAGCQGLGVGMEEGTPTETANEMLTVTESGTERPTDATVLEIRTPSTGDGSQSVRPDPATDRLGWENGYWHNDSLDVDNSDGLNDTELSAVVNRSMARVEYVRGLEFEESVPVTTVSRAAYRNQSANGSYGDALRTFDNAKFEALFLIGENDSSVETQESTLGDSVQGYYSPSLDEIVIVTDSETPRIGEKTLSHELVHAVQDQQFGLEGTASTRDARQGRNALLEGDARTVETAYEGHCGSSWSCVSLDRSDGGGGASPPGHWGLYFLVYFPYSDGSVFVSDLRDRGGWDAVNDAYDDIPEGAREVTTPTDYPEWEPREVTLPAPPSDDWEQVRPSTDRDRPDYATVGPSGIAAAQVYTLYDDYNESAVTSRFDFFNYDSSGRLDSTDPLNYDLPGTSGWDGGRMQVYTNDGETGYVWRTAWTDDAAAQQFATSWERVIQHWGGERTADGNWVIAEASPFGDAVAVHVEDDTVTVVNAPTESELTGLYDA